jgi:hypothetical protein
MLGSCKAVVLILFLPRRELSRGGSHGREHCELPERGLRRCGLRGRGLHERGLRRRCGLGRGRDVEGWGRGASGTRPARGAGPAS